MKKTWFICFLIIFLSMALGVQNIYASVEYTDSGLLWLVNQDNRLEPDYVPPNLTSYGAMVLHPLVGEAFERMLAAMQADGINGLRIQSAYRTYVHQQTLFRNKKIMLLGLGYDEETSIEMTSQSIAFPGASEHQTGLAIDVTVTGELNRAFADTEASKWIDKNSHLYGFVVRYTEDKTEITRIIYEPWHLRYIGLPHSAFMKEKGLCFEEYIDYLQANGMYIYWCGDGSYYLVRYVETLPDEALPNQIIECSADRPGPDAGYIITTRKKSPRAYIRGLSETETEP